MSTVNCKGLLQEFCVKERIGLPVYVTSRCAGTEDHTPSFDCKVTVNDKDYWVKSVPGKRKHAEQLAAKKALTLISATRTGRRAFRTSLPSQQRIIGGDDDDDNSDENSDQNECPPLIDTDYVVPEFADEDRFVVREVCEFGFKASTKHGKAVAFAGEFKIAVGERFFLRFGTEKEMKIAQR